jgi:hypothetical protein
MTTYKIRCEGCLEMTETNKTRAVRLMRATLRQCSRGTFGGVYVDARIDGIAYDEAIARAKRDDSGRVTAIN